MIKKFIVVGALAVAGFGVAAASASALPINSGNNNEGHGRIQQSDAVTATCQTGPMEFNYVTHAGSPTTSDLFAYNISPACYGSKIAAAAYDANNTLLETSSIVTMDAGGTSNTADANHLYPTVHFSTPLQVQQIDHTVITISDGLQ